MLYEEFHNPSTSVERWWEDGDFNLMSGPYISPPEIECKDRADYERVYGYTGSFATPLVQVFSVGVSTNFDDGKPCEIHGSIRVLEGPDCQFYLYDRDPEDSETIYQSGKLSLIGPHDGAILPSMITELNFQLTDKIHGVDVVNGNLSLDLSTQDSYDRLKKGVIEGKHGSAYVYYAVFRFAFYGYVHITVIKNGNDDNKRDTEDIYGSVVATYDNCSMYCNGEEEDGVNKLETRLFDHPSSCVPFRVLVGTPIRMSRNVVVVPAYSTLAIDLNLWNVNGKIASGRLKFPAYLHSADPVFIQTQYARVKVQIKWQNAYLDPNMVRRRPKELHDQHLLATFVRAPLTKKNRGRGEIRAEVFTVFIGGINEKVSALCGTILVEDGSSEKTSIYNRDESCSELLQDHSLASIEVNYRPIENCVFYIILNLTDPAGKLELSRGDFSCNLICNDLYNKRLCSVVPGKDGYAAVHYEVFDNASKAFVEVKLFAANGDVDIPTSLYGTLLACYSGHNYSTSYEKLYYKSRLIDHPLDSAVESKTGSNIALLKSIVVVPARSSLIIEADLGAFGINNVVEVIHGKAEFEINICDITISKRIPGQDYGIEISIKFKD